MTISLPSILGVLFYVSENLLGWRRHSSKAAGAKSADAGTMRTLWRTALLSIFAGVLISLYRIGPPLPANAPWGVIGTVIFALGVALRWWAIIYLGRFFTVDVAVAEDHRVVDTGPYGMMRHPSYTGLLLMYLGFTLTMDNLVALPVILIPVTLSLLYRMRIEETTLLAALGENYAAYCRRTKRLVPMVY